MYTLILTIKAQNPVSQALYRFTACVAIDFAKAN